MSNILGVLIIAYLFGLSPLCAGAFAVRKSDSLAEIYTKGWLINLALFWLVVMLVLYGQYHLRFLFTISLFAKLFSSAKLSSVVWIYLVMVTFVNICGAPSLVKSIILACKNKKTERNSKLNTIGILIAVLLIPLTIFFIQPYTDDAVEQVQIAVSTNSLYAYSPYVEGASYIETMTHIYAPVEMLWACGAKLSGLASAVVVKRLLPVFLLPLFYSAVSYIGESIFYKRKDLVPAFFLITLILMSYSLYAENAWIAGAILSNPWNGLALLNCVILPVAFAWGFRRFGADAGKKMHISFALVLLLAAQTVYIKGAFDMVLVYLFLILTGLIIRFIEKRETK